MNEDFYFQLKSFFKKQGITQEQIAEDFGKKQAYINMMLNGKCSLGRTAAQRFHDLYGLSIAWLLTGEGEMMDEQSTTINITRNGNVTGDGNNVGLIGSQIMEKDDSIVMRLIDELSAQRKQIDELISIIKNNSNG